MNELTSMNEYLDKVSCAKCKQVNHKSNKICDNVSCRHKFTSIPIDNEEIVVIDSDEMIK